MHSVNSNKTKMKKSRKPESFIQKTVYPGGVDALRKDIMELMNYPEEAIKANVEGSIVVTMDIDNKGIVSNAKIKKGLGHGLDEEAVRIATLLKFTPTHNRGVRVVFHETLNITFNIREYLKYKQEKEAAKMIQIKTNNPGLQIQNIQISYNTPEPKNVTQEKKEEVKYNYTIATNKNPEGN